MLLERDPVLGELDLLVGEAIAGRGHVAFVVGEAGIGKTSVLRAVEERIKGRARLLRAVCEDLSATEALALLRDLPLVEAAALDHAIDSGSRIALFNRTLERLTDEATVLVIEDLHWADDGSIDFLRYVGRRIADRSLLIIVASRNEDLDARTRLSRASGDLPPTVRRRFDLSRLSAAAVGELAAAHGMIGSEIHRVTDGNPLLVTEMLATGSHRSSSIDDLVLGRADRLDRPARTFLDQCSIVPRRVSLGQIEASGAPDQAIRACIESGLLVAADDGLAFRHEITRRIIEDALPPLRRRQLHGLELMRLENAGASAARRLHHALHANDTARVQDLAPEAAEQASTLGAHREAVRAWSAILDGTDPPAEPRYLERYAFELHVIGNLGAAVAWQERALDLYRARDERLREGDALRFLSRLHYLNGYRTLAEQAGERAVTLLADFPGTAELALAYANLAQLAMLADDPAETERWSEQAIPIAEQLGRDDILATVLNNYGTAIQHREPARSIELLDRSIMLATEAGSQEHVARAYTNKAWTLMQGRQHDAALAVQCEGVAFCEERDLDTWRDYMSGGHALTLLRLGRWNEAAAIAGPIVADPHNTHLMRNPAVSALALLQVRRGKDAAPLIEELRAHMANGREAPRYAGLALIVAEYGWTRGEPHDEALVLLDEALALTRPNGSPWDRAELWVWLRKLGSDTATPSDLPAPYVRLTSGDLDGAAEAFADLALPFEQARTLVGGDSEQAARGLAILDRLGASATAERVRAELAGRGIRRGVRGPRTSTRGNSFGLTIREIDVLRAIEKGWTNKEIGERLFVSAKTVDHHVSSILGKLDARTRGEAAARARAEGILVDRSSPPAGQDAADVQ